MRDEDVEKIVYKFNPVIFPDLEIDIEEIFEGMYE
jgi:hypothetical protein